MANNPPRNKNPWVEGIKEFLRIEVLALLPVLYLALEQGWDWNKVKFATGVAALRAAERFLHEYKKTKSIPIPTLPF